MNFLRRLYSFDDDIDFRKGWRVAFVLSGLLFVIGLYSLISSGLSLGIDFKGGTSWQFPAAGTSTEEVRDALRPLGAGDARIQVLSQGSDARIRVQVGTDVDPPKAVAAMAEATGKPTTEFTANQSEVGPSWGQDVSRKAIRALIVFFLAVAAYISWRLEWRMAVGGIIAVLHDLFLSVAVYAIFGWEVTPGTVIAFLTILGYSLYDTIVVYDKVHANETRLTLHGNMTYTDMMNLSLNQTFVRSLNTTFATVLPVLSILLVGAGIMGAVTLEEFGRALLVGLIFGAYSSVFIASPIVAALKEREPRNIQIRENVLARRAEANGTAVVAGAVTDDGVADGAVATAPDAEGSRVRVTGSPRTAVSGPYSDKHPPRPRKKGKKR